MPSKVGGVITSGALDLQLRKDIDNMFNATLASAPDDVGKVFKTKKAPSSNRYTRAEIAGFGLPSEIPEGGVAQYDIPEEGFERSYFFTQYGMAYVVTQIMLEDEQYGRIKQMPKAMAKSIMVFKNYDAFDLLNNGETSAEKYLAKDGNPLFASHTLLDKRFGSASAISNQTARLKVTVLLPDPPFKLPITVIIHSPICCYFEHGSGLINVSTYARPSLPCL